MAEETPQALTPEDLMIPTYDPDADVPFLEPDLRPDSDGLKRGVVFGVGGTLVVALLGGTLVAMVRAMNPEPPPAVPPPPPKAVMAQALPPIGSFLQIPTEFEGQDRREPKEVLPKIKERAEPTPKTERSQRITLDDLPSLDEVIPPPPGVQKPPPGTPGNTGTTPPGGKTPPSQPRTAPTTSGTSTQRPKKKVWLFAEASSQGVQPSPFDQQTKDGTQGAPGTQGSGSLFKQAKWEVPAERCRVLYAQQLVQGVLMQNIDTDLPGTVRIRVVEEVQDRFGEGCTLVPLYTVFISSVKAKPTFGQKRIDIAIGKAEFPQGGIADFTGATAGDSTGANGVPGEVNNHILGTIAYAGISAVLNIGTRAPFGSTQGFQQSLPQEYAQDVASSLSRSGQDLAKQNIQLGPTIIAHVGDPVVIMLNEAMSFMTPAVKVAK